MITEFGTYSPLSDDVPGPDESDSPRDSTATRPDNVTDTELSPSVDGAATELPREEQRCSVHGVVAPLVAERTETLLPMGSADPEGSTRGGCSRATPGNRVATRKPNQRKPCGDGSVVSEINRWLGSGRKPRPQAGDPATGPAETSSVVGPSGRDEVVDSPSSMDGPELPSLVTAAHGTICHEIHSYRLCYPRRDGPPSHEGIAYCPHTAAVISILCSTVFSGHLSSTVASRIVALLAPHQHPETPPSHYPAGPLIPLKICSLNKRLQHDAGAPLVQLLWEYKFHLSRFYNELYAVAMNRSLPSVRSLRDIGTVVRTRMETIIRRRQTCLQILRPGQITLLLPDRPATRTTEPTPFHPSHLVYSHLRAFASLGNPIPEFIAKLGVSPASTLSASPEPPPYSPISDEEAGTCDQTTNTDCITRDVGFSRASSPAYSDVSDESYPAPDTVSHSGSA